MAEAILKQASGRLVELSEAVGTVLAHDMTEIRRGEYKGPAFKKGHVVRAEDLGHLARLGKNRLYVLEINEDMMHEDEAALVMAQALAGPGIVFDPNPSEGKINLIAEFDGLLKVHADALTEFNMVEGVMCASRHTNTMVRKNNVVAGTRAVPLVIARQSVEQAAAIARDAGGIFSVKPMSRPRAAIVVTGSEVFSGLIEDRFGPVMAAKLEALDCPVIRTTKAPDDSDLIAQTVLDSIKAGAELLITTGGLSVDPDDVTRLGVLKAGGTDIIYGSSVLPGAMLLLAKVNNVPLIGVPACGMFHDQTIFDLLLPRLLAGEFPSRRDIAALSHGGLCLNCPDCRFPVCPFGKSIM